MVQRDSHEAFDQPLSVAAAIAVAPRCKSRSPRADPNREWCKAQKGKGKSKDGIKGNDKGKEDKRGDRVRGKGLKAATLMDVRSASRCGMASRVTASATGWGAHVPQNVTACTSGLIAPRWCLSDGAQQEAGTMVARPSSSPLFSCIFDSRRSDDRGKISC